MEQQVRDMEPILAKKAEEGIALVNRLKIEQKAADEVKQAVMKDEAEAKVSEHPNYIIEVKFVRMDGSLCVFYVKTTGPI